MQFIVSSLVKLDEISFGAIDGSTTAAARAAMARVTTMYGWIILGGTPVQECFIVQWIFSQRHLLFFELILEIVDTNLAFIN